MNRYIAVADSLYASMRDIERPICPIGEADWAGVSAIVVDIASVDTIPEMAHLAEIPIIVLTDDVSAVHRSHHYPIKVPQTEAERAVMYATMERLATVYETSLLPDFFRELSAYAKADKLAFDCPGHQRGDFYRRHPAGRMLVDFLGDHLFAADLCNADVALGDLLIHEGPALAAQRYAASVFHADKTYFVLNGTSAANKVVLNAVLAPGDVILYDRNNHKSVAHGALVQAGAVPVYMATARNDYGMIGGILSSELDEDTLRERVRKLAPQKADKERPFRLAVVQLGTYDGSLTNARAVVDRIGHLCEYILFDSAWVGYEAWLDISAHTSPLLMELSADDPGIFVTQSVHKQQAGFSQTSQIHKKDAHIKGQDRYVSHKRVNHAFMMHASTSPFYPLFASLVVNAKMADGKLGRKLWQEALEIGIEARKDILNRCRYIRPFIPPTVHGSAWQHGNTRDIGRDAAYFSVGANDTWHGFDGYGDGQYMVDPMKLLLITDGVGKAATFGIPAAILAEYLRSVNVIPEKCNQNAILFLLTPAESNKKMRHLVDALVEFERLLDEDSPLETVLPNIVQAYQERYAGYTIRQLCQEMHDYYQAHHMATLQKQLFQFDGLPEYRLSGRHANDELARGHAELVDIHQIVGRVALEEALPYPPGVPVTMAGETWTTTAADYFIALHELANHFPGFAPEVQGVYRESIDGEMKMRATVWTAAK